MMRFLFGDKSKMVDPTSALPGRDETMPVPARHEVLGTPIAPPFPDGLRARDLRHGLLLGRRAHVLAGAGVYTTAVGYAGGFTPNPTYEEVCSRPHRPRRGRARRLRPGRRQLRRDAAAVLGEPRPDPGHAAGQRRGHAVPLGDLLRRRPAQREAAERSRATFQQQLGRRRLRRDHDRDRRRPAVLLRRAYHQQYLAKNPNGYCGLGGTGVSCPVGRRRPAQSG